MPLGNTVPAESARLKDSEGVPATAGESLVPAEGTEAARLKAQGTPVAEGVPRKSTEAGQRAGPANGTGAGAGSDSGKAGQGFVVNPDQYKAAVSPVLAASEQIASLAASLGSYLPSMESQNPWGNDESGKQFAEGENGYLEYSHNTLKTLQSLVKEVRDIADGLKRMGESYEAAEEGATGSFTGMGDSSVPMPPSPGTAPTVPTHVRPMMTPGMTRPNGRH
jgi:hypothetical protein